MNANTVRIDSIQEEFNPRSNFNKVDDIADSIRRIGLLQPLVVREIGNKGDKREMLYAVVDGACRLRALKQLGIKEVQVQIIDEKAADEAQLAANLMRSDLNILERARGYERLMKTYPAKYNAAAIAKAFGTPTKTVERMISIAKRIPSNIDSEISKHIGKIGLEDLEIIAQVPDEIKVKLAERAGSSSIQWELSKIAKELDFATDAINTGALIAAGKAFAVKFRADMREDVYTLDAKVYGDAKAAFEKDRQNKYGADQEKDKARRAKEAQAKKDLIAKRKKSREAAQKIVKTAMQKFIRSKPNAKEMAALGEDICARFLNTNAAKAVYKAFGIPESKGDSWTLTRRVWKDVFAGIVTTAEDLVSLHALLSSYRQHDNASFEEQMVAKAAK